MKQVLIIALAVSTTFVACQDSRFKAAQMDAKNSDYSSSYDRNWVGYSIGSAVNPATAGYAVRPVETRTVIVEKPVVYRQTRYVSTSSQPAKVKKGWSKAAKGAVIGAGTGAVLGAVVSKDHRGRNAVIGAVLGAGGGYVIGRQMDKKDGRVQK